MALNIRGKGGRKNNFGGDQSSSPHLQQAGRLQGKKGAASSTGDLCAWPVVPHEAAAETGSKKLTDLQEAAGGEITAAPWQRADIHQN